MYRFALPRLDHDQDAAGEVAQAAICKAIGKLHTYRGEAALLTWLCTFCRHELYAYGKRHQRHLRVELLEDDPEIRAALESLRASAADDLAASLIAAGLRRSCSGRWNTCRLVTPTRSSGSTSMKFRFKRSVFGSA